MLEYELEILNGCLLSDGCITKPYTCKNYQYAQGCIHLEYINYLQSQFSFPTNITHNPAKPFVSKTNHKSYTCRESWSLRSGMRSEFTELRQLWYPEGIKKLPPNLILTPTSVLHWYLGDGSMMQNGSGIELCTDSFSKDDRNKLIELLRPIVLAQDYTEKNRIRISNNHVWEFLEYIGSSPVECFGYKWDTIVKTSYYGRKCAFCHESFDATQNHQQYCSAKCCNNSWKKRIIKKSQAEKPSH